MGGNAFENTSRLDKHDYVRVKRVLSKAITNLNNFYFVQSYYYKETFGDMDICYINSTPEEIKKEIEVFVTVDDVSKNGPVTSFLISFENIKRFQIDFIKCKEESFNFSCRYFDWNDCGNLIGRIAHRIGLKFGHEGLFYVHRVKENTYQLGEYLLTDNFDLALSYLDLDSDKHFIGFNRPEDIYEFITSSKYFCYSSVDLERRNHVSRIRDKKRVMYTNFLKWLSDNNLTEYNALLKEKNQYLQQHFEFFPSLVQQYNDSIRFYDTQQRMKAKFNGEIVSNLTLLEGKELGAFISQCKKSDWFEQILSLSDEDVKLKILLEYIKTNAKKLELK